MVKKNLLGWLWVKEILPVFLLKHLESILLAKNSFSGKCRWTYSISSNTYPGLNPLSPAIFFVEFFHNFWIC